MTSIIIKNNYYYILINTQIICNFDSVFIQKKIKDAGAQELLFFHHHCFFVIFAIKVQLTLDKVVKNTNYYAEYSRICTNTVGKILEYFAHRVTILRDYGSER